MQFLEKPWKILRTHRDVMIVTTNTKRIYLVSETNYHTKKSFL